jgi:hypothetical protein
LRFSEFVHMMHATVLLAAISKCRATDEGAAAGLRPGGA